jgi:hypothetical protein
MREIALGNQLIDDGVRLAVCAEAQWEIGALKNRNSERLKGLRADLGLGGSRETRGPGSGSIGDRKDVWKFVASGQIETQRRGRDARRLTEALSEA